MLTNGSPLFSGNKNTLKMKKAATKEQLYNSIKPVFLHKLQKTNTSFNVPSYRGKKKPRLCIIHSSNLVTYCWCVTMKTVLNNSNTIRCKIKNGDNVKEAALGNAVIIGSIPPVVLHMHNAFARVWVSRQSWGLSFMLWMLDNPIWLAACICSMTTFLFACSVIASELAHDTH